MAAGSLSEAAFKEVCVKVREAQLAYGSDPATPEADGEDNAGGVLVFDEERSD